MSAAFERQLLAVAAFEHLSDDDKAALEAVEPGQARTAIYDLWAAGVTDYGALAGTELVPAAMVKRSIHGRAPHLTCEARFGTDAVVLTFMASAARQVRISGFTRAGEIGESGLMLEYLGAAPTDGFEPEPGDATSVLRQIADATLAFLAGEES